MGYPPRQSGSMLRTIAVSATAGVTLTAPGTTHTKSAWTELVAALAESIDHLRLVLRGTNAGGRTMIDIGVGAAGSEIVVVPNIVLTHYSPHMTVVDLPIRLPAGARVAARYQQNEASDVVILQAVAMSIGHDRRGFAAASTYGATTSAATTGTAIDPGGTANTKGAWVQLTAATEQRHRAIALGLESRSNFAMADAFFLYDIGVGAAGSEQIVVPDIHAFTDGGNIAMNPQWNGPFPCDIPVGSRLAVRGQCSGTDATDRVLGAVLYGFS